MAIKSVNLITITINETDIKYEMIIIFMAYGEVVNPYLLNVNTKIL